MAAVSTEQQRDKTVTVLSAHTSVKAKQARRTLIAQCWYQAPTRGLERKIAYAFLNMDESSQMWKETHSSGKRRNYSDDSGEDYNNDVVGLIRAGSGPGSLGPQTCECVFHCRSLLDTGYSCIHTCACMCWAQVHTNTQSCCRACLANELPNLAPAILIALSANLRGKYDSSHTPNSPGMLCSVV